MYVHMQVWMPPNVIAKGIFFSISIGARMALLIFLESQSILGSLPASIFVHSYYAVYTYMGVELSKRWAIAFTLPINPYSIAHFKQ